MARQLLIVMCEQYAILQNNKTQFPTFMTSTLKICEINYSILTGKEIQIKFAGWNPDSTEISDRTPIALNGGSPAILLATCSQREVKLSRISMAKIKQNCIKF